MVDTVVDRNLPRRRNGRSGRECIEIVLVGPQTNLSGISRIGIVDSPRSGIDIASLQDPHLGTVVFRVLDDDIGSLGDKLIGSNIGRNSPRSPLESQDADRRTDGQLHGFHGLGRIGPGRGLGGSEDPGQNELDRNPVALGLGRDELAFLMASGRCCQQQDE